MVPAPKSASVGSAVMPAAEPAMMSTRMLAAGCVTGMMMMSGLMLDVRAGPAGIAKVEKSAVTSTGTNIAGTTLSLVSLEERHEPEGQNDCGEHD
jgi:hypothetical protein